MCIFNAVVPFRRLLLLLAVSCFLFPVTERNPFGILSQAHAKPMDGLLLESATTLRHGAWDIKFGAEFGSGAEPLDGPATVFSKPIVVDVIRAPLEIRYGLSDRSEIGWSAAFEADAGPGITAGTPAGPVLDAGGLQNIRFFGKWKIRPRFSWKADFAIAGNNALTDGSDGVDLDVKFMYGPRIGAGTVLFNLGVDIKSGNSDFNDNGAPENYDNPIGFGVGYIYPFTNRSIGIFELSGRTSPFAGVPAAKIDGNNELTALAGLRYGWDRFSLTTGAGFGILSGSPNFTLRLGLNWMLGAVKSYAQSDEDLDFWAPTEEDKKRLAEKAERKAAPGKTWVPVEDELTDRRARASEAFARRDYVAAATHYEAAINLKNDDPVLHYNLATTYYLMRRYAEARPYYQAAIRLNPSDVDSHLYLGYVYYYLSDSTSAAREWQRVLDLDPGNELARNNLNSLGVQ